jgi:hypothetical protein
VVVSGASKIVRRRFMAPNLPSQAGAFQGPRSTAGADPLHVVNVGVDSDIVDSPDTVETPIPGRDLASTGS